MINIYMDVFMRSRRFISYILFIVFASPSFVIAENVELGRYSTVKPVATPQQIDLLSVVFSMPFNKQINTVGEAIEFILLRSGYRLAPREASDPNVGILLEQPLPFIHRKIGPITIENALKALAGNAWNLVVDPVNRYVSFDLKDMYRTGESLGKKMPSDSSSNSGDSSKDGFARSDIHYSEIYVPVDDFIMSQNNSKSERF